MIVSENSVSNDVEIESLNELNFEDDTKSNDGTNAIETIDRTSPQNNPIVETISLKNLLRESGNFNDKPSTTEIIEIDDSDEEGDNLAPKTSNIHCERESTSPLMIQIIPGMSIFL